MQRGQPSKKIRLETSEVHNEFDDDGLWGEDLNFDDEVMQQLESQALSQYQETQRTSRISMVKGGAGGRTLLPPDDVRNSEKLQEDLQMKQGEVKNLRIENDKLKKEFNNQLSVKDELIEKLKKQLSEKQSEIEFQKMEKLSQTCKTPKSARVPHNTGSPFHDRFQFTQSKGLIKDGKVFNFGGQLNKGDVLYKLLRSAFNLNLENSAQVEKGNEFTLYLNCCLLQLCRFTSFEKSPAVDLIKLIIFRSHDVLLNFLRLLTEKEIKQDIADKKTKVITLSKSEDGLTRSKGQCSLLTNAQWFYKEKGVATRQTVTMLAKLMQIEPLLISMLIKTSDSTENRYDCNCIEKVEWEHDGCKIKRIFALKENKLFDPFLNRDMNAESLPELTNIKSWGTSFDILELFDEIVQEICIRKKSYKYEGVFCSLLYFCSTLCNHSPHIIDEKHKNLIVNMVRKIIFSLPGSNVIRYIVDFLSSSALYNLSDFLCHRSAAETFTENFRSFCFTEDTCILQVLCAQIEMTSKSAYFIYKFTSWIVKVTTGSHHIKWMRNEPNSKLCECLPAVEQVTIRILLHCAEKIDNENLSVLETVLLKSSTKQCCNILKQFRWHDDQFIRNIANCLIEYEMLLQYLTGFADDESARKFVSKEIAALRDRKNHHLRTAVNVELIKSVLEFSPIIGYDD